MSALDEALASINAPSITRPPRRPRTAFDSLDAADDGSLDDILAELGISKHPTYPSSDAQSHAQERSFAGKAWDTLTTPIKTVVGATQGVVPKALLGGTDAYARAREAEAQARFGKPAAELSTREAIEGAPGFGDVAAEWVPEGVRNSAVGTALGPIGRLAGNIALDPTTYLGGAGALTKVGKLTGLARTAEAIARGERVGAEATRAVEAAGGLQSIARELVNATAVQGRGSKILNFLTSTQNSGEVARGIRQLLKGEPIGAARSALALPTSAYTGLAYAPDIAEGIARGAQETVQEAQQGNVGNAVASGTSTLLQTGLAALVGRGVLHERDAMRVMRDEAARKAPAAAEDAQAATEAPPPGREQYIRPIGPEQPKLLAEPSAGPARWVISPEGDVIPADIQQAAMAELGNAQRDAFEPKGGFTRGSANPMVQPAGDLRDALSRLAERRGLLPVEEALGTGEPRLAPGTQETVPLLPPGEVVGTAAGPRVSPETPAQVPVLPPSEVLGTPTRPRISPETPTQVPLLPPKEVMETGGPRISPETIIQGEVVGTPAEPRISPETPTRVPLLPPGEVLGEGAPRLAPGPQNAPVAVPEPPSAPPPVEVAPPPAQVPEAPPAPPVVVAEPQPPAPPRLPDDVFAALQAHVLAERAAGKNTEAIMAGLEKELGPAAAQLREVVRNTRPPRAEKPVGPAAPDLEAALRASLPHPVDQAVAEAPPPPAPEAAAAELPPPPTESVGGQVMARIDEGTLKRVRRNLARLGSDAEDLTQEAVLYLADYAERNPNEPWVQRVLRGEGDVQAELGRLLTNKANLLAKDRFRAAVPTEPISPTGARGEGETSQEIPTSPRGTLVESPRETAPVEEAGADVTQVLAGEIPDALAQDLQKRTSMKAKDIRARVQAIDRGEAELGLTDALAEMSNMIQGKARPFGREADPRLELAQRIASEMGIDIGKKRGASFEYVAGKIVDATGARRAYEAAKSRDQIRRLRETMTPEEAARLQFKTSTGVSEEALQARGPAWSRAIDEGAPIGQSPLRAIDLEGDGPAVTQQLSEASQGLADAFPGIVSDLRAHLAADANVVGFTAAGPIAGVRVGDRTVLNPVEASSRTERATTPEGKRRAAAENVLDTLIHETLHARGLEHGPAMDLAYADALRRMGPEYVRLAERIDAAMNHDALTAMVPEWTARRDAFLEGDTRGVEPPIPDGMTRLYRGESGGPSLAERPGIPEWAKYNAGRWFTSDRAKAERYNRGRLRYVDVPEGQARAMNLADMGNPADEHMVTPEIRDRAQTLGGENGGERSTGPGPGVEGAAPRAVPGNPPEGLPNRGGTLDAGARVPEAGGGPGTALPPSAGPGAAPRVIRPIAPPERNPPTRDAGVRAAGGPGADLGAGGEAGPSGVGGGSGAPKVQLSLTPVVEEATRSHAALAAAQKQMLGLLSQYQSALPADPRAARELDAVRTAVANAPQDVLEQLAAMGPRPRKKGDIAFTVANLDLPLEKQAEAALILKLHDNLLDRRVLAEDSRFENLDAEARKMWRVKSPEEWLASKKAGRAPRTVADAVAYKQLIGLFDRDVEQSYTDLQAAHAMPEGNAKKSAIDAAFGEQLRAATAKTAAIEGLANHGTFMGRGLATMRYLGNPLTPGETFEGRLASSLKRAGVNKNVAEGIKEAYLKERAKPQGEADWGGLTDMISKSLQPRFTDKVLEFWKAGLLGWPTQIANTASNVAFFGMRNAEEALSALMRGGVRGAKEEMLGRWMGLQRALATLNTDETYKLGPALADTFAFRPPNPARALERGSRFDEGPAGAGLAEGAIGKGPNAGPIEKKFGEIVRTPFKMLSLADDAAKLLYRYQFLGQEAMRFAREGKFPDGSPALRQGEEVLHAGARIFNEMLSVAHLDTTNPELFKRYKGTFTKANAAMTRDTFQAPVGPLGRTIQGLNAQKNAVGFISNLIVPFVRTPTNVIKEAAWRTPVGLMRRLWQLKKGDISGVEATSEIAKGMVGSAVMLTTLKAALDGTITGGGPTDPKQAALLKESGWQPYSFRLPGGKYVSYQRLEPVSTLLGIASDMAEGIKRGEFSNWQDSLKRAGGSIAENLTNKTFLSGLEGAVSAMNDPFRYGPQFVKQLEASLVPNIIGTVPVGGLARAIDPTYRQTEIGLSPLVAKIPGLSTMLPAQHTPLGEERQRPGSWFERMVSPLVTSDEKTGPVADVARELDRIGYAPQAIPAFGTFNGQRVYYTREEQEALARAERKGVEALASVIKNPAFTALPDKDSLATQGQRTKEDVVREVLRSFKSPYVQLVNRRALDRAKKGIFRPEPMLGPAGGGAGAQA